MKEQANKSLLFLLQEMQSGICHNEKIAEQMMVLSRRLMNTGGKKVYGYLKADVKAIVNGIVDELAKEEKREPKIFELFTCHTLRHTYATRCYENGVDQQVVQKLLGHSTLAMTTDLYTHVSEEKKKEEVAELKILA